MSVVLGLALTMALVRRNSDPAPATPMAKALRVLRARSAPRLSRQPAVHRPIAPLRIGDSMRR